VRKESTRGRRVRLQRFGVRTIAAFSVNEFGRPAFKSLQYPHLRNPIMRSLSAVLVALFASVAAMPLAKAQPRSDGNGDPLPAGAIARLGSARFVHGEMLTGLNLSPDGSTALAADDHRIALWDVATGRELREFKNIKSVMCAALSPDGKLVAACENGPRVWIWDAQTGRELRKLVGKTGRSATLAWSPDSKWIAAYADDRVNIWDVANGDVLHRFDHGTSVSCIAFSPDGKRLVTGIDSQFHILWDIATEKELLKLKGGPGRYRNCRFAPDGKTIAGYCEEGTGSGTHCSLRTWDAETGKRLRDVDRGPFGVAGFAPDGKSFCATTDKSVRVYDTASGEKLREWKAEANIGRACLSGDGKRLAGWVAGRIRFWNPETGKELRPPTGHLAGVTSASFAPDGKSVASGSADDTVRIWDWATGIETARHPWNVSDKLGALHHRPDGTLMILDSAKGRLRIRDPRDERSRKELEVGNAITSLSMHSDGKTILTIGWQGGIGVWNLGANGEIRHLEPIAKKPEYTSQNRLVSVSLSTDGKSVAWAAGENRAGVVDFATGKPIVEFELGEGGFRVEKVLFAPDGKTVATSSAYGNLKIWNSKTGERTSEWVEAKGQVLAYSPDGRFIALADNEIVIWDVAARKELIRFAGHRGKVNAIAFEPRGRVLASASADGTLLVWDLTGKLANAQLPKKALTERELAVAWDDLKSPEPARAQQAVVALARGGAGFGRVHREAPRPRPGGRSEARRCARHRTR